jgi:hypothetical protein
MLQYDDDGGDDEDEGKLLISRGASYLLFFRCCKTSQYLTSGCVCTAALYSSRYTEWRTLSCVVGNTSDATRFFSKAPSRTMLILVRRL